MTQFVPYKVGDRWTIDTDPNDILDYVGIVTQWMMDNSCSGLSFDVVSRGVTVLQKDPIQGELGDLLPVKLQVTYLEDGEDEPESYITFRVTTDDEQQFDKTIWFNKVQN